MTGFRRSLSHLRFTARFLVLAGLSASCEEPRDERDLVPSPPDAQSEAPPGNAPAPAALDTTWSHLGSLTPGDSILLVQPTQLLLDESLVYVFDPGDKRVTALQEETGRPVWTYSRSGEGPGEFEAPTSVATDRRFLYVLDYGNGKVVTLGKSDGAFVRDLPLRGIRPRSMCKPADDPNFFFYVLGEPATLVETDPSLEIVDIHPVPWPESIAGRTPLLNSILEQSSSRCLLALVYGMGFLIFDTVAHSFSEVHRYPGEAADFPSLEVEGDRAKAGGVRHNVTGIGWAGDQVGVVIQDVGASRATRRIQLLQVGDPDGDGRMLRLPIGVIDAEFDRGRLYLISGFEGEPAVLAIDIRVAPSAESVPGE